jgi:predicted  nucleic acid-binding Zn-ribbon protein
MGKPSVDTSRLLTTLQDLEDQARDNRTRLHEARSELDRHHVALAESRNTANGYRGSPLTNADRLTEAAEEDQARLKPLITGVKKRIADLEETATSLKVRIAEITEGAQRVPLATLAYQQVITKAETAAALVREFSARKQAAEGVYKNAVADLEAAEMAQTRALDPEEMALARSSLEAARQKTGDAQVLIENLKRRSRDLQQALEAARQAVEQDRRRAWKALRDDRIAALSQACGALALEAFAAACAAGEGSMGFSGLLSLALAGEGGGQYPTATDAVMARLAADLGVPSGSIKFRD